MVRGLRCWCFPVTNWGWVPFQFFGTLDMKKNNNNHQCSTIGRHIRLNRSSHRFFLYWTSLSIAVWKIDPWSRFKTWWITDPRAEELIHTLDRFGSKTRVFVWPINRGHDSRKQLLKKTLWGLVSPPFYSLAYPAIPDRSMIEMSDTLCRWIWSNLYIYTWIPIYLCGYPLTFKWIFTTRWCPETIALLVSTVYGRYIIYIYN